MRGGDFNSLGSTGKDEFGAEDIASELLKEAEHVRESNRVPGRRVGLIRRLRAKFSKRP
ncbi:MAG: hypothetical protein ACXWDU_09315 [Actinomycetota bacterium]